MNQTSSVDCPQCHNSIAIDTSIQLTSLPPQYPFRCGICGYNKPVLCSDVRTYSSTPKKINPIHQAMRLDWGSSISEIIDFAEGEVFQDAIDKDLFYFVGEGEDFGIKPLRIGDIILKDSRTGKVEIIKRK